MTEEAFAKVLRAHGARVFIVGGWVRDALRHVRPHDKDYMVSGIAEAAFQQLFPDAQKVGHGFLPVYLVSIDGCLSEVAFARKERKEGQGYRGFRVSYDPSVTVEEDLYRRDTTMNSMALELPTKTLIDPYHGADDVEKGIIRAVSPHFTEDPVRALRAARQAAEFGIEIRRRSAKNEIHLSIPPVGSLEVSRSVMAFRESHPELRIKLYEDAQAEAVAKLGRGRRDFVLTIIDDANLETSEELETIPLGEVSLKLCVNKDSPLAALEQVDVCQVGNHPLVMMKDNYYQNMLLSNRFRKLGIEPNIILYSGLFTTLRKYVKMGYAAGFAYGSDTAESDSVRYIPLVPRMSSTFGILCRKSSAVNPNVREMIEYLKHTIKV